MESAQILKTKAMREREELRAANMYKFSLIRVRFPDGVILQVLSNFNYVQLVGTINAFYREHLAYMKS